MKRRIRLIRCPACGVAHPVEPSPAQKRASARYEKKRKALREARKKLAEAPPDAPA